MEPRARFVMIGGFLGAGKTTAVARLARELTGRGLRVGLITNDQSTGLVDTRLLREGGFVVEEIAGGCFCCRFGSLREAAERLDAGSRPDVFLAEPVGSCTDLVATVSYPLRRIYGDRFTIAPLSVMVDPTRAARVLGLEEGRSFSERVVYVYEKQLEEAELIVVNKVDRLDVARRRALVRRLEERFPRAQVLACSALEGTGLAEWFARLAQGECRLAAPMELDYALYGEGEALLGWLNATVRASSAELFDADRLLVDLAEAWRAQLAERGVEIAHLKATLDAGDAQGQLSALSVTGSDATVDLRESLLGGARGGELLLNLRAEADPELLFETLAPALRGALRGRPGLELAVEHCERFRPAQPEPTHRLDAEDVRALAAAAGSGATGGSR